MKEDVGVMADTALCCGCGTCASICKNGAVTLFLSEELGTYLPSIDRSACTGCGNCLASCPMMKMLSRQANLEPADGSSREIEDECLCGPHLACFMGNSKVYEVLQRCASGGLVSTFLLFLMEEGEIDDAIITKPTGENPFRPRAALALSKDDILKGAGSYYCPVPVNKVLSVVSREDGRYAYVGLPCHLLGLKGAELMMEDLRGKIAYRFGLFCSHTVSFHGTTYLLRRLGVNAAEVTELFYRSGGWPGGLIIRTRHGVSRWELPLYWDNIFGKFFFTPTGCLFCDDGLAEEADISFGDAWLPESYLDNLGKSIIVVRTKRGLELAERVLGKGLVELTSVNADKVIKSQRDQIFFKKMGIKARLKVARHLGVSIPLTVKGDVPGLGVLETLCATIPLINSRTSQSAVGRRILDRIPARFLRYYGKAYQLMLERLQSRYGFLME